MLYFRYFLKCNIYPGLDPIHRICIVYILLKIIFFSLNFFAGSGAVNKYF